MLQTLNLSAALMHYLLAIGFSIYFSWLNRNYDSPVLPGVEMSARDHVLDLGVDVSGNLTIDWVTQLFLGVNVNIIQGMLISFFFITGSFHLFYYLSSRQPDSNYTRVIENKNNYYRWIEYSITSTLMLYIMALVGGTKDTGVYMMLFSSNVAIIAMGQWVEEGVKNKSQWHIPMLVSFLLLLTEFGVIARNFFGRLDQIQTFVAANSQYPSVAKQHVPGWLRPMLIVLFIFYCSFGFLSLVCSYANVEYETVETCYILLSFFAKATLGAFVGYGMGLRQQGLLTPVQN